MVDPMTGGALIAAWAGRRVVGPVLDEMGVELREHYSERRKRNFLRIGEKAKAKLGDRIEEQGEVPPRVALQVLEDGSWCDHEVMSEYFGGILAASRSQDPNDDRGATWAALVSRMSTYDIWIHYLCYEAFRRLYLGTAAEELNLGNSQQREQATVYLPGTHILRALGLEVTMESFSQVVSPSVTSLLREGLLGDHYAFGPKEHMAAECPGAPDAGLMFATSSAGAHLFLWAHGVAAVHPQQIMDPDLELEPVDDLGTVAGAQTVKAMREADEARSDAETADDESQGRSGPN